VLGRDFLGLINSLLNAETKTARKLAFLVWFMIIIDALFEAIQSEK